MTQEQLISEIAREVIARLQGTAPAAAAASQAPNTGDGVFSTVDEAVKAAAAAQAKVGQMSLEERGRIVAIIRRLCVDHAEEWARLELEETGLGRLDHKTKSLQRPPRPRRRSHAQRRPQRLQRPVLIEHAPWGVIGMVLPATHSVPTMAKRHQRHRRRQHRHSAPPAGASGRLRLRVMNRAIQQETGAANVITTMANASIRAAAGLPPPRHRPALSPAARVVRAAAKSGKRVIAAGPGNPPVVVDETADLDNAAKSIIIGASFDNNLLCIGEKEVFVVASVFDAFLSAMKRAGAVELNNAAIERLTEAAFTFDEQGKGKGCGRAHLRKELIGKDVSILAAAAGIQIPAATPLLFGETVEDHAFVQEEQMMPFVPIVKVLVNAGIAASLKAEHNYRHTAIIHSRNLDNVTRMARAMNTTLFVSNAACVAALGSGNPSYLSFSIATPTGEGVTTPMTFTRERQFAIGGGAMRII